MLQEPSAAGFTERSEQRELVLQPPFRLLDGERIVHQLVEYCDQIRSHGESGLRIVAGIRVPDPETVAMQAREIDEA